MTCAVAWRSKAYTWLRLYCQLLEILKNFHSELVFFYIKSDGTRSMRWVFAFAVPYARFASSSPDAAGAQIPVGEAGEPGAPRARLSVRKPAFRRRRRKHKGPGDPIVSSLNPCHFPLAVAACTKNDDVKGRERWGKQELVFLRSLPPPQSARAKGRA